MQKLIQIALISFALPVIAQSSIDAEKTCNKKSTLYHDDGSLQRCKLNEPVQIDNINCEGWLWLYLNGKIRQCQLAQDYTWMGNTLPAKTIVNFKDDGSGNYIFLPNDFTIQGYLCKGGGTKSGGISTSFHPNGVLKGLFLTKDTEIQGVLCRAGSMNPVYFYDSGKLQSCILNDSNNINDIKYTKNTEIQFNEDGSVQASKTRNIFKVMGYSILDMIF